MSTHHTPGPWSWIAGEESTHLELTNDPTGEYSEDSILYHGSNWKMTKANAALIAAAPELLAALEELVDVCPCRNGCKKNDITCATNKARAAIAKAKGQ